MAPLRVDPSLLGPAFQISTGHAAHTSGAGREAIAEQRSATEISSRAEDSLDSPRSTIDTGFSTQYGGSASSPAGQSGDETGSNYFVSAAGEETELERDPKSVVPEGVDKLDAAALYRTLSPPPLPIPFGRTSLSGKRPPGLGGQHHTAAGSATLLPCRIGLVGASSWNEGRGDRRARRLGYRLTRKRCEDGLLLGAVVLGVWKLAEEWGEVALAGEIGLLIGLSVVYLTFRCRRPAPRGSSALSMPAARPQSPGLSGIHLHGSQIRERSSRTSHSFGTSGVLMSPPPSGTREESRRLQADEEEATGFGAKGCIWGTEEREYRECLDDGVLYALLLGPLVAAALLHGALTQISSSPTRALPKGWLVEPPLVLATTPLRHLRDRMDLPATDHMRALSALVTSRRNLVQLFTLCSFVLLVQLAWSLRHEIKLARASVMPPTSVGGAPGMEREGSDGLRSGSSSSGIYWLRRGELRRNGSVIGFAFLVTGGCLVVKIVTAMIGHGVWSDMSASDIVIATLFYQFSLYVCVRLARRGFTLGELGVVCNAATALLLETVNMTRMKIPILRTPYIKTYRLPTPLLTFQLALIPGSLLAGFLLSPLLYLSRNLAQKPVHRLRFPQEKDVHRRLLALGFYGGAVLVCGGIVGMWTRWCLGWRDPFVWVVRWLLEGRRSWTRPALLGYWGALAMISVAGWSRQLFRARRHRRYVVPGVREAGVSAGQPPASHPPDQTGLSGVASQMMDAADQRLPTLSVNARRKFFHALAVVMFVPGIAVDPAFTHLSFSVAFAFFNFAEYIRYFALWPFGVSVHLFLNEFLDHKDSGTAILSHFYLLAGCASPLWLEGPSEVMAYFGVLTLGIGDALASIVGRRVGRVKWSAAGGKTVEGTVAFLGSVLVSTIFLWAFGAVGNFRPVPYVLATGAAALLEAFSAQNDNLILPMYGWALGILLGV